MRASCSVGCHRLTLAVSIVWCECAVFYDSGIDEANKPCLAETCNWCTCTDGRPAPALGDDSALVCSTDGEEDCRACDAGFVFSAPVRASRRGSLQSVPLAAPHISPLWIMPCHAMPMANTLHPRTTVGAARLAPACRRAAVRRYHDSIPAPNT